MRENLYLMVLAAGSALRDWPVAFPQIAACGRFELQIAVNVKFFVCRQTGRASRLGRTSLCGRASSTLLKPGRCPAFLVFPFIFPCIAFSK